MYKVILLPSGLKALRQEPEMKEPDQLNYLGFNGRTLFKRKIKEYRQHLGTLEIIDIAPEYKERWKVGDLVSENDFIKNNKYKEHEGFFDYGGPQYIPVIEAIPKEQEKESGVTDDELYESIYMEVVQLVEKDNIQCEEYLATVKKLAANYHITKK